MILRGDVAITTVNAQGKSIHLTDVKVGQIFGELALMQYLSERVVDLSKRV